MILFHIILILLGGLVLFNYVVFKNNIMGDNHLIEVLLDISRVKHPSYS